MIRNVIEHLQSLLNEEEIALLNEANKSKTNRQDCLRSFFHNPSVFNKVKDSVDPTWLSTEIFINGKAYEF
jgi:hypothetical protein